MGKVEVKEMQMEQELAKEQLEFLCVLCVCVWGGGVSPSL